MCTVQQGHGVAHGNTSLIPKVESSSEMEEPPCGGQEKSTSLSMSEDTGIILESLHKAWGLDMEESLWEDDEKNDGRYLYMLPSYLYRPDDKSPMEYAPLSYDAYHVPIHVVNMGESKPLQALGDVSNLPQSGYEHPSSEMSTEGIFAASTCVPVSDAIVCIENLYSQPSYNQRSPRGDYSGEEIFQSSSTEGTGVTFQISYGEPFEVSSPVPSRPNKTIPELKNRIRCPVCYKTFPSLSSRQIHIGSHTKDRQFKCDICNRKFIYKHNLAAHMRVHDPVRRFSCPCCGKMFRHKYDRNVHVLTFACTRWSRHILDSADAHVCLTCSSAFKDRDTLIYHVRQHNKGLAISCPVCDAPFSGVKGHALVKHVKTTHPDYMTSLMLD